MQEYSARRKFILKKAECKIFLNKIIFLENNKIMKVDICIVLSCSSDPTRSS